MNSIRIRSAAVFFAALAGCTTLPPTTEAVPREATRVAKPFGFTWSAAVDVLAEKNIAIQTIDRSSGLIIPAQPFFTGFALDTAYADCGHHPANNGYEALRPVSANYNVRVKGDSSTSSVQVNATYIGEGGVPCVTRGKFESSVETAIKAKAESSRQ